MDALGVVASRLFDYIEIFFRWVFKKQRRNNHVDHFKWTKTYMPLWVEQEAHQFVKREKHIKYRKMYLRGRHWEYKVYYRKDGSVDKCERKLRWNNNGS